MPKIICGGAQNKGFFGADAVTIGMQIGGKNMARTDAEKLIGQEMFIGDLHITSDDINYKPVGMVEVRHGKWITMSDADGIYWACSECGEDIPRISHYNPKFNLFPRLKSINRTNYCPNCGAKMDL